MIKFEQIVHKKNYKIFNDEKEIADLELITPSSISNRFDIIYEFVESMSNTLGEEFDEWFSNFFKNLYDNSCSHCHRFNKDSSCMKVIELQKNINKNKKVKSSDFDDVKSSCDLLSCNETIRTKLVHMNVEKIKYYVDKYLDIIKPDFSVFVNKDKIRKTSIVFDENEIEKIMRLSSYFKLYSIIFNSNNLRLDIRFHKKIFNMFIEEIDRSIIEKIFEIIRTKTFKYKQTDQFMWEYIKIVQGKEIETYIIEIFNFLMNNIMVLCQMNRNPITYFVTVVDSAIIWILRSVYKASVIYSDEISSDDIQTIKINNLNSYSYNDTLGCIKIVAYDWVYRKLEDGAKDCDRVISEFHNKMENVTGESPLITCLVYPLLSKLTNIPYRYFRTLNSEQSIVLSAYMKHLLTRTFRDNFKNLFHLLECYPEKGVPDTTSYKMQFIPDFVNLFEKIRDCMGFDTCVYQGNIYLYIIGRLARIKFANTYTHKRFNVNMMKVEADAIQYYTYYFAGLYDENKFAYMKNELIKSF